MTAPKCHLIPSELNPRFWGRSDALEAVKATLDPERNTENLRSFALYGMGGVVKTQIALEYANRNRERYDTILWIAAENTISLGQSIRDIARVLGLSKNEEDMQDTVAASLKVKGWLKDTRKSITPCLLNEACWYMR
jgi:hypothetical protein